jgi:membrane-bound ClpP family serine protease
LTPVQERLHMTGFVLGTIALLGLMAFLGRALWAYVDTIGTVFMIFLFILAGAGCFEVYSIAHHRHHKRRIERDKMALDSKVIEAANIAAYVNENGTLYHLSAYEENAKIFPVQSEETTLEVHEEVQRLKQQGLSERVIAGRLNMSRPAVRLALGKPRTKQEEKE